MATLLLDAYLGTVDDEGEGEVEAQEAANCYISRCLLPYSLVAVRFGSIISMSFVVVVKDCHYIDPVATASGLKGEGLARAVVDQSLSLLAADGIEKVGAVITDGNVPSEKLFASLGFVRVGTWGQA